MRFFVDAHALIWSQDSPELLGPSAADALTDLSHELLIGKGTIWEMGIKASMGKLPLSKPFEDWITIAMRDLKLSVVQIDQFHIVKVGHSSSTRKRITPIIHPVCVIYCPLFPANITPTFVLL
jgi:PIN domain nuclease of toxin-antitoxin system